MATHNPFPFLSYPATRSELISAGGPARVGRGGGVEEEGRGRRVLEHVDFTFPAGNEGGLMWRSPPSWNAEARKF